MKSIIIPITLILLAAAISRALRDFGVLNPPRFYSPRTRLLVLYDHRFKRFGDVFASVNGILQLLVD
jgi:hypothetical protein